jgi:Na+-transporting methylmalonyl-CoA/oxaloacetate decarboxylase gamma subunit
VTKPASYRVHIAATAPNVKPTSTPDGQCAKAKTRVAAITAAAVHTPFEGLSSVEISDATAPACIA